MPKTFLLIVAFSLALSLNGQNDMVVREVIASSGDNSVNNNIEISWTLGEFIIESFEQNEQNTIIVAQGFHNNLNGLVPTNMPSLPFEIEIYPVPTNSTLAIRTNADQKLFATLFDLGGRVLLTETLESINDQHVISVKQIPSATYILQISDGKGRLNNFKIQKI